MAASASLMSSSGSSGPVTASPTLIEIPDPPPFLAEVDSRASTIRRATRGRSDVMDVRHQDGELVASHAGHGVAGRTFAEMTSATRTQDAVAHVVAERIVDLLEPVEVAEADGHGGRPDRRPTRASLDPFEQEAAVGEPVSSSWKARWRSSASRESRSVWDASSSRAWCSRSMAWSPCDGASTACGRRSGEHGHAQDEMAATLTRVPDTLAMTSSSGGTKAARATSGRRCPFSIRCQSGGGGSSTAGHPPRGRGGRRR